MGNWRYRKGRQLERDIVREAKEDGKIAFRSAGSKSPIDVCIIDEKNKIVQFVQCKTGESAEKHVNKLMKQFEWLNGPFIIQFSVFTRD